MLGARLLFWAIVMILSCDEEEEGAGAGADSLVLLVGGAMTWMTGGALLMGLKISMFELSSSPSSSSVSESRNIVVLC